jgi:hypothetical protein
MPETLQKIIDELITLDPELKQYEKQLPEIIQSILSLKPEIKIDAIFKNELKNKLEEKMSQINNQKFNWNFMKKINYALGAVVMLLVLSVPLWIYQQNDSPKASGLNISQLADGAFGQLSYADNIQAPYESTSLVSADAKALDGSISSTEDSAPSMAPMASGGSSAGSSGEMARTSLIAPDVMPPYRPTYYQYVYQGDDFDLNETEMAVLKRLKGQNAQANFDNLNLGLLDLASFGDSGLNNFNIIQDKKFGYSIYVNLVEGSISLSENWEKWYEQNYLPREFKSSDVPADATVIAMTDQFLAEHNINTDIYGEPEVQKNFYNIMPMLKEDVIAEGVQVDVAMPDPGVATTDSKMAQIYPVSNSVSVVYPLMIDGKQVYDDWGNKQGLQLNINLEFNKVSSMYNLMSQNYQSSNYKMETDKDKIMKLLRFGSIYYYSNFLEFSGYPENQIDIIDIAVGTPKIEYVKTWQYKNNSSEELLVPALVFPILNPEKTNDLYKKNVVIPLSQEIIDQAQNPEPTPILYQESR